MLTLSLADSRDNARRIPVNLSIILLIFNFQVNYVMKDVQFLNVDLAIENVRPGVVMVIYKEKTV